MENFLRTIIKNKKIVLVIVFFIIIIGLFSYDILPKQQSPKITLATAMITTVYPGAAADDMERLVTSKIEDELSDIEEAEEIISYSKDSVSVILYTVKYSNDYSDEWDILRRKMTDLQPELPEGAEKIDVNTDFMETVGLIYALSGENYTYDELEYYGEDLSKELQKIDGVSKIKLEGMLDREVLIEIDERKIKDLNLSYGDIANLIKSQNIEIPSGQVQDGIGKINVRTKGFFESIEDIENIVVAVSKENGIVTRIKDIGKVNFEFDNSGLKTKIGKNNAILLVGYFEKGKNIVPIGKNLERKMDQLTKNVPRDINIEKILFEPDAVADNLGGFLNSLMQGIIFVIIIVFLGLGIRNSIIVSIAIPMSLLMTFTIMNIFGVSVQQISITALIIALGMLVDNAIVVSDAIQIRIDNGEERIQSCVNGILEVRGPVLTATLTTICTFLPIFIMGGEVGDYLKSMSVVVIGALISSYLVAITITPVMASIFFKKRKKSKNEYYILDKIDGILSMAIEKKLFVFIVMALIICFTFMAGNNIGLKFFPFAETDMMYIDVNSEIISDLNVTEKVALKVADILDGYKEIDKIAISIGDGLPRFFDTMFPSFPSSEYAQLLLKINLDEIGKNKDYDSMTALRDDIQKKLDENLSMGTATVKQLEQGEPIGSPVSIRLTGEDISKVFKIAKELEKTLYKIEGTSNVKTDFVSRQYEYLVDVDKISASRYGLSNYEIQNEINIALNGRKVGIIRIDNEEYNIEVRSNISDISELSNLNIKSDATSNKILLKNISKIELNSIYPVLKKVDKEFSIEVSSDVLNGYSSVEITDKFADKLDDLNTDGVNIIFSGEKDSINKNFGKLGAMGLIFILVIYIILLFQFKSFVESFIILFTVPLALVGSILGLYITGLSLSFTAFLGMISLAGIVINNGIVLIDCINSKLLDGIPKNIACKEAAKERFRPIILSTVTTVMGLVPLAMMKSSLFTPMAVSLMFGLMVSTLLTIIVIPVAISFFLKTT